MSNESENKQENKSLWKRIRKLLHRIRDGVMDISAIIAAPLVVAREAIFPSHATATVAKQPAVPDIKGENPDAQTEEQDAPNPDEKHPGEQDTPIPDEKPNTEEQHGPNADEQKTPDTDPVVIDSVNVASVKSRRGRKPTAEILTFNIQHEDKDYTMLNGKKERVSVPTRVMGTLRLPETGKDYAFGYGAEKGVAFDKALRTDLEKVYQGDELETKIKTITASVSKQAKEILRPEAEKAKRSIVNAEAKAKQEKNVDVQKKSASERTKEELQR